MTRKEIQERRANLNASARRRGRALKKQHQIDTLKQAREICVDLLNDRNNYVSSAIANLSQVIDEMN